MPNNSAFDKRLVPHAQGNLAKIPDDLRDEQVVLLADIASTGISTAESADVKIGDTVAVFAQGPIGLCATAGAKLKSASLIIAVESDPARTKMARRMGAGIVLDHTKTDVIVDIRRLTAGEGVDVAIEALGTQATFEGALRVLRAGGTLSNLGVYSGKVSMPNTRRIRGEECYRQAIGRATADFDFSGLTSTACVQNSARTSAGLASHLRTHSLKREEKRVYLKTAECLQLTADGKKAKKRSRS